MTRHDTLFLFALTSGCLSGISGCGNSDHAETPAPPVMTAAVEEAMPEPSAAAGSSAAPSERQTFDGLGFVVPALWEQVPLSQFQAGIISAKFAMPAAGEDVTLTLSRSGGSMEDNLNRWRGQFAASRPEVVETISVAGVDATQVDLEGRFSAGFGREPADGWRMLGVVVPLPDQAYFIKLTGPIAQVAAVEDDFKAFVKSAQK